MARYDANHVKNVCLLGHAGSGKTTLAECMLFEAGLTNRRGTIAQGNTVGDFHELEKERGNTVFSSLLNIPWRGYKINVIDTPGSDDFSGEVLSALRVADTGVMVLNASAGVEVTTDTIWAYTEEFKTPTIFIINHLDKEDADFESTLNEAKKHFGANVIAVQYPLNQGNGFNQIVDVLNMVVYKFAPEGGKPEKLAIPESEKDKANALHQELVETIAANDEGLMERYFEKGELDEDEMREGLHQSLLKHDIFPVFCTSAERNMGSGRIMGFIDNVCPSALEMPAQTTKNGEKLESKADGPTCIFVFKTIVEPHIGELSLFKVYSGTIKEGMELVNETTGVTEKINQLYILEGHERIPVKELAVGDIGATIKLKHTHVNNTLHTKGENIELSPIQFPHHNMSVAIEPTERGQEDKLAQALHTLKEEDATIHFEVSAELKQTLLHCMGELHLKTIEWKLEHIHGVNVRFEQPKIPYRETITSSADASYRHKKQSGGSGQFGEVSLRIDPWVEGMPEPTDLNVRSTETIDLPWGGKLVFLNCIVGGAIDTRFIPSVLKGIQSVMAEGPLTGSYVRDIRVALYDGKMHPVDSNDLSFKIAAANAFKDAFNRATPQLLEPLQKVEVLCTDDQVGAVMGDLQTRMGIVEGMEAVGSFQKITAKVPQVQLHNYSSALRGLTHGQARFSYTFAEYAPVDYETQQKLVKEHSAHIPAEASA
jgi:elongation factor G